MVNLVDKDTVLCVSLAQRPSNHGVRFHNWLYNELGLNYLYKAIAPADIAAAVVGVRGLNIRGAGVSMPYKTAVIDLIDQLDSSAERIGAVNTIVNDNGHLVGYNTDYSAVAELLEIHRVARHLEVAVKGSGGMAQAVVAALADYGLSGTVVARNQKTGTALAKRYNWAFATEVPASAQMLVNVTPLGMTGPENEALSFNQEEIERAEVIFDCVAYPVLTPLIKTAQSLGKSTIDGGEVVALQAAKQFHLYTGIRPSDEQILAAEAFAQK